MTVGLPEGPLYAVALTREGAGLASRLAQALSNAQAWVPERFAAPGLQSFSEPVARLVARLWDGAGGFLLVMAAGIAVRAVAPLLRDKATDPAVVVLDAAGKFAIPLVGGHLGGANDLAREIGLRLGATPVITTATDAAGRPAAEVWARENGLRVEGRAGVVRVNAAWANGDPVGAYLDPALESARLLDGLAPHLAMSTRDEGDASAFAGPLLAVTHRLLPDLERALFIRPPCLALGVGCRRRADPRGVVQGVRKALAAARLAEGAVAAVASVDAKADEPALQELARTLAVPFLTFSAAELAGVQVPNPSARVSLAVGTSSVAEAAALSAAGRGELLVTKVKGRSWTLAVAIGEVSRDG